MESLKNVLGYLEKEEQQKNVSQCISSDIVKLRTKIKGREEKLKHNFNRYQDREIILSDIQSRADEMVRENNMLFENAYNFAIEYMSNEP